jgi:lysyl-tRNA synthetase class I
MPEKPEMTAQAGRRSRAARAAHRGITRVLIGQNEGMPRIGSLSFSCGLVRLSS